MKLRSLLPQQPAAVGMRRLTLQFSDPDVEAAFRDADNRAAVGRARFMTLLAFVLSLPFGWLDLVLSPDYLGVLVILRAIGSVALLAIAALTIWWPSVHRCIQFVACGALAVYSWCTVAAVLLTDTPRTYASVGTVLLMLGLVGVIRVRFRSALMTAIATFPLVGLALLIERESWQLVAFDVLSLVTYAVLIVTVAFALERSKRTEFLANRDLDAQRQLSDDLLHNILPEPIARRLRENPSAIAESVDHATVLFADIVGFTPFSAELPPAEIVQLLDLLFGKFDDLCDERGIEKVKTIGDAYMAVAGTPRPDPDHAASVVELAFDMQRAASAIAPLWPTDLKLRIGISSGPVVAGVIGRRRFAYDLWGDTVNTASRMESHGVPNRIQVSESTYELLKNRYEFSEPQEMDIKGKGTMSTYFLVGPEQD
ncbi:MAG TPA: adenylate/guanylate cyclase domain-containing protein [Aeromicrobium sp.]|nr:adenylate/guanylate cyclase domain-containing protein [Aeromicrobium sp.]HKY57324.1 adenylate/guanylate cyclase domain-containing protein [Aeromicrobium sp.]